MYESSIRYHRMCVFFTHRILDSVLTECDIIVQINPLSHNAFSAYCYRAAVFKVRGEYEKMRIPIESAEKLRKMGYGKAGEGLLDLTTAAYEAHFSGESTERLLAVKRAQSEDDIGYDPTRSNEWNFHLLILNWKALRAELRLESHNIPILCSYRSRIDAMVHLAVDSGNSVFPSLHPTQVAKFAVLWTSDAIKSPLLLFRLRHPGESQKEFNLESLLRPQQDTSLLYPDEGLIIAYHLILDCEITSDCLIRWVINNGTIIHCDRVDIVKDELFSLIEFFPNLFGTFDPVTELFEEGDQVDSHSCRFHRQIEVCRKLHTLLLGGIEVFLADEMHVTFVPDRELFRVPFGCLFDDSHGDYGKYLIERMSFSVSSSLRMIAENAKQKEIVCFCDHSCPILVCGDPKTTGPQGDDEGELVGVSDVVNFLGDHVLCSVLTQSQFVGSILRETCYRLRPQCVHIISHGSSDEDRCHKSDDILSQFQISGSLACSNGTELTAESVAETFVLKGIDLVFLNVCELARGRTHALGVLGFNRAVFQAGCPSVVSALWNVYPRLSSALAKVFYLNYFSGKCDKSESLQMAIRSLLRISVTLGDVNLVSIRNYPVFWAPYQLFGNRV